MWLSWSTKLCSENAIERIINEIILCVLNDLGYTWIWLGWMQVHALHFGSFAQMTDVLLNSPLNPMRIMSVPAALQNHLHNMREHVWGQHVSVMLWPAQLRGRATFFAESFDCFGWLILLWSFSQHGSGCVSAEATHAINGNSFSLVSSTTGGKNLPQIL